MISALKEFSLENDLFISWFLLTFYKQFVDRLHIKKINPYTKIDMSIIFIINLYK